MLHQALTNSYGSRLLSCIDYRDRAGAGGGPPGRRAVGVRTAEPLPVRCVRARGPAAVERRRGSVPVASVWSWRRPAIPLTSASGRAPLWGRWPAARMRDGHGAIAPPCLQFAGIRVGVNRACVRAPPRHLEPVPVQSDRHREWLRIDECERRPKMVSHTRAMR